MAISKDAYKRGPASIAPGEEQRPMGEATDLNEQLASPEAQAALSPKTGATALPDASPAPDLSGPMMRDAPISFQSEDDEILYGPTIRPEETFQNQVITTRRAPAPQNLEQYLALFSEASRQPNAPPELQAFLRILSYNLGKAV